MRPYLKKPFTKIGLVEWLKVKALSSSPSTAQKRKKKKTQLNRKRKHWKMSYGHTTQNKDPAWHPCLSVQTQPCPKCIFCEPLPLLLPGGSFSHHLSLVKHT
jgi:hypothetical protein